MEKSVLATTGAASGSASFNSGTVAPKRWGYCSVTTTGRPITLEARVWGGGWWWGWGGAAGCAKAGGARAAGWGFGGSSEEGAGRARLLWALVALPANRLRPH
jgi:hypothetical protein